MVLIQTQFCKDHVDGFLFVLFVTLLDLIQGISLFPAAVLIFVVTEFGPNTPPFALITSYSLHLLSGLVVLC